MGNNGTFARCLGVVILAAAATSAVAGQSRGQVGDDGLRIGAGRGQGRGSGSGSGGGQACRLPTSDDHAKVLSQRLSLGADQASRIRGVLEQQLVGLAKVTADVTLSQDDRARQTQRLREDSVVKIAALLNDRQRPLFDDMRSSPEEILKERQLRGQECSLIWFAVVQKRNR